MIITASTKLTRKVRARDVRAAARHDSRALEGSQLADAESNVGAVLHFSRIVRTFSKYDEGAE